MAAHLAFTQPIHFLWGLSERECNMSVTKFNEDIQDVIERRMKANCWTPKAMTQYFRYHIDGEGEDDATTGVIESANLALSNAFSKVSDAISGEDISKQLDLVLSKDRDWLAHLDIALAMATANPRALEENHIEIIRGMLADNKERNNRDKQDTVLSTHATRFLNTLGLRI